MCFESETSFVAGRLRRVKVVKIRHFSLDFVVSVVAVLLLMTKILSIVFGIHL